jgi:hypothetical protein
MGNLDETPAEADKVDKVKAAAFKQLCVAYRMTFSGVHGELVLADLKERMMYGVPAYQPGGDAMHAAFVSGNQDAIAYILMKMTQDPNGRAEQ